MNVFNDRETYHSDVVNITSMPQVFTKITGVVVPVSVTDQHLTVNNYVDG